MQRQWRSGTYQLAQLTFLLTGNQDQPKSGTHKGEWIQAIVLEKSLLCSTRKKVFSAVVSENQYLKRNHLDEIEKRRHLRKGFNLQVVGVVSKGALEEWKGMREIIESRRKEIRRPVSNATIGPEKPFLQKDSETHCSTAQTGSPEGSPPTFFCRVKASRKQSMQFKLTQKYSLLYSKCTIIHEKHCSLTLV